MARSAYDDFERLRFDYPAEAVLRVTMTGVGPTNSADARLHEELATVWPVIDRDPEVNAVILCGTDAGFSAGADFGMIQALIDDYDYRLKVWREARDIVYNVVNCSKPIVAAINKAAVGAGLAAGMVCDITIATKDAKIIDGHTRLGVAAGDHAVIVWPLLCGMAKAKYYLLTCDPLSGEEAERIGLISLCVEDDAALEAEALEVASKLAQGAQTAIRFTKLALNNWLRQMGPAFDASLAMEFLGWDGEAKEGLASWKEKRKPSFPKKSPI